jgi:hypothetical protein
MRQVESIRTLFLGGNRSYSLAHAAALIGWPVKRLRSELSAQYLVPEETWEVKQVPWRAIAVLAVGEWSYAQIEQALGDDASILPQLVRAKELHVRLPGYQIAALVAAAQRSRNSIDEFLSRHLVELACSEAPSLSKRLPGFREAFHWPDTPIVAAPAAPSYAAART